MIGGQTVCVHDKTYAVNAERVFSERFDGDTIIIDLHTGLYYALNLSGSFVWEALISGISVGQIVDEIKRISQGDSSFASVVSNDVRKFVTCLIEASLLVNSDAIPSSTPLAIEIDLSVANYVPPKLILHDDIKDVLLADIVHSVGPDGWPRFTNK